MPTVIITGSGGLIGSESVRHFVEAGFDVIGLDNDMAARFFDPEASMPLDRCTIRCSCLQGRCRCDGAGIRALLRAPDGVLPWRLSNRTEPCRRAAARLPRVSGALHRHRGAVHGDWLQRQAGAGQHPCRRRGLRLLRVHAKPRAGLVYNLGGGRFANCSMLEAIAMCERISGRTLSWKLAETPRIGDHRWWISGLEEFRRDYPVDEAAASAVSST